MNSIIISRLIFLQNGMSAESLEWAGTVVRFLVNTEGCGYPPYVNCTRFADKYGYVGPVEIAQLEAINQPQTRVLYRRENGTKAATIIFPPATFTPLQATTTPENGTLKVFPCYYSRAYPDRVVAEYDWYHTVKTLVAAVVIPWTLFFVSCAVLSCWYCPALKREFMIDRRRTAAVKNENSQVVIR